MFNATYFTYDGIISSTYGLQIASFDSQSQETTTVFAPTLTTLKSSRGKVFHHAGIKYEEAPTFTFQIVREDEILETERRVILAWLVGRAAFKPLIIHQSDLEGYTYNCVFSATDIIYVNGRCHGFEVTATFDSWFCHGKSQTVTYEGDGTLAEEITITNNSDILDGYVYPTITFTNTTSYSGNNCLSIINETDDETRETLVSGLSDGEILTMDGETMIIKNSDGTGRVSCSNKLWPRLLRGANVLSIRANGTVVIECPTYVLIGF